MDLWPTSWCADARQTARGLVRLRIRSLGWGRPRAAGRNRPEIKRGRHRSHDRSDTRRSDTAADRLGTTSATRVTHRPPRRPPRPPLDHAGRRRQRPRPAPARPGSRSSRSLPPSAACSASLVASCVLFVGSVARQRPRRAPRSRRAGLCRRSSSHSPMVPGPCSRGPGRSAWPSRSSASSWPSCYIVGGSSISSQALSIVVDGAILYYLNQPGIKSLFGRA